MADDGGWVIIDRSRITHGDTKKAMMLRMKAAIAERDLDLDGMQALLEEVDHLLMKVIVGVPKDWLPEGVTLSDPKWIDQLSQERYEKLVELTQPVQPGEKKA